MWQLKPVCRVVIFRPIGHGDCRPDFAKPICTVPQAGWDTQVGGIGCLLLGLALCLSGCRLAGPPLDPSPARVARQVADRVLADCPEPPPFDWGEGVLMAGMMHAGIALDEPRYVDFVRRWADHWHAAGLAELLEGLPGEELRAYCGRWGPGYPLVLLYEKLAGMYDAAGRWRGPTPRTGADPRARRYLDMALQIADFIVARGTRTRDGGFGHWEGNYQLWVDTLYMLGPLFARVSLHTGRDDLLEEAVRQMEIYADHTQDERTGLFWHMWDEPSGRIVGTLWGRGNGWVAMSYVEVLRVLPPGSPRAARLMPRFRRLMEALPQYRDEGVHMWHTVLDHPETYYETSASAMILGSLVEAGRLGLIPPPDHDFVQQSWAALAARVDGEGHVFDVSGGTIPADLEIYAAKIQGTYTWGTGAFLMAATSLMSDCAAEPTGRVKGS